LILRVFFILLAVLAAGSWPGTARANPEFQKKWEPQIEQQAAGRGAKPDKWKIEEEEAKKKRAPVYCKDKRDFVPEIDVVLVTPDPVFVFTKSIRDLNSENGEKMRAKWADTREKQVWIENANLAGLARGGSGFHTRSRFVGIPYGGLAALYCPFFKKVEIQVFYSTTIFVASDFKKGSCRYNDVLEHEMTHHNINLKIVTEYAMRLEKDLPKMLAQIENYGYVSHDKIDYRFELMRGSIADAVDIYGHEAWKKMQTENAKIDTIENYEAEAAKCRGKA
jgi:hypothetical protein